MDVNSIIFIYILKFKEIELKKFWNICVNIIWIIFVIIIICNVSLFLKKFGIVLFKLNFL